MDKDAILTLMIDTTRREADRCRAQLAAASTAKQRREAAEALEFWTNRAAFLSSAK